MKSSVKLAGFILISTAVLTVFLLMPRATVSQVGQAGNDTQPNKTLNLSDIKEGINFKDVPNIDGTRTMTIYGGINEDFAKRQKSLKGMLDWVYLKKDDRWNVTINDFNWTFINITIASNDSLIPVRISTHNRTINISILRGTYQIDLSNVLINTYLGEIDNISFGTASTQIQMYFTTQTNQMIYQKNAASEAKTWDEGTMTEISSYANVAANDEVYYDYGTYNWIGFIYRFNISAVVPSNAIIQYINYTYDGNYASIGGTRSCSFDLKNTTDYTTCSNSLPCVSCSMNLIWQDSFKDASGLLRIRSNSLDTFGHTQRIDYVILSLTYILPIIWSSNSTNSTVNGTWISHNVFWNTSAATLSGYIFSFYNGSNSSQTTLTADLESGTQTKTAATVWYQTGQKLPTTNYKDTSGSNNWTTPANLYTDNAARTTAISINSKKMYWGGFSMGIPSYTTNLTINSINVTTQGSNNGTGTVTHTVAVSNDSGETRCPTTASVSYTTTTDANTSTLNSLWGCTWTAAQANGIWIWFNATTIPVSRMVRVDVAWVNISYNIGDLEVNGTDVYYNDTALTVYPQLTNISIIVNVSTYNNSGSAARSNNNPQLHVRIYNGTNFINIGFIQPTGVGNYTVYTTNSAALTAWQTLANRDMIINAEYMDYVNAGQYDTIAWNSIWVQPNSTGDLINDSWVPFTGTQNWSNVTKFVNVTVGATIKWKVYANNSDGLWNSTDIFLYNTTSPPSPPSPSFVSPTLPNNSYTQNQSWIYINVSSDIVMNNNCTLNVIPNMNDTLLVESTKGYMISWDRGTGWGDDNEHIDIGRLGLGASWTRGFIPFNTSTITANVTRAILNFSEESDGSRQFGDGFILSVYYNTTFNHNDTYCRANASTDEDCWNHSYYGVFLGNVSIPNDPGNYSIDITEAVNNDHSDGIMNIVFISNRENLSDWNDVITILPQFWAGYPDIIPTIYAVNNSYQNITMNIASGNKSCWYNATNLVNQTSYYFRVFVNGSGGMNVTEDRNITVNITTSQNTSFTIKLPNNDVDMSGFTPVQHSSKGNFTSLTGQEKNVNATVQITGESQTASVAFVVFNNTGVTAVKWEVWINQSLPASIILFGSKGNDPNSNTFSINASSWATVNTSVCVGCTEEMWIWANFTNSILADTLTVELWSNSTAA